MLFQLMNLSGNTGYYKYQVSLIDSKNHKILDILPCRYKHELCTYFRKYSYEERCKVKYFISDLWETYKDISMTYFPKAKIIAGEIHVFDTNAFTVEGKKLDSYQADVDTDANYEPDTEVIADGYFHESEFRSAPYFDLQIDGITLLNSKF